MPEKTWRQENNERVAKLLDALGKASAALQQAARYAADLTGDHVRPATTKKRCLDMVTQVAVEAQAMRQFLV